jgi:hypothetical protein
MFTSKFLVYSDLLGVRQRWGVFVSVLLVQSRGSLGAEPEFDQ